MKDNDNSILIIIMIIMYLFGLIKGILIMKVYNILIKIKKINIDFNKRVEEINTYKENNLL